MLKVIIAIDNFSRGGIPRALKILLDLHTHQDIQIDVFCGDPTGIFKNTLKNCRELPPDKLWFSLTTKWRNLRGIRRFLVLMLRCLRHLLKKTICFDLLKIASTRISRRLDRRGYDVAIAFSEDYPAQWVAATHIPRKIVWIHNDYDWPVCRGYEITDTDFGDFQKIVCVSNAAQKAFCRIFPGQSERTVVIPNATSVDDVLYKAREKFPLNSAFETESDVFKIVSIGRICYQKQFDAIPGIARQLLDAGCRDFKWYIIGSGSKIETEYLVNRIQEHEVGQYIILLGEQSNPYPYLKHADLLVLTSRWESYGIVVDEAKILGIPSLITNYGAATEVLPKEYGEIAPIDDFPERLMNMLSHPEILKTFRRNLAGFTTRNEQIMDLVYDLLNENLSKK